MFVIIQRKKHRIPESEKEAKQNWHKFALASSITNFGGFKENDKFLKILLRIYLKKFPHSF